MLISHIWPRALSFVIFQLGELGWIAMDAFFVLSGFLITGILLDTRSRPDYFRSYYTRRTLRIFPLYYLTLVLAVLMMKISHGGSEYRSFVHDWGSPAWFFLYLGNFRMAYLAKWPPTWSFTVFWSLQIEEQFYLLFPFAVRYLRRDHLVRLLWCLVFLSPIFRLAFYLWNPDNLVVQYVLLPCHMDGLALGALIAIRFRSGAWEISKPKLTLLTAGLLLVTCAGSLMSKAPSPGLSTFSRLPGYSLASWASACLVVWLIVFRGSRYTRLFRTSAVGYMATISYGLYLLHPLVMRFVRSDGKIGLHMFRRTLASFAVEVILTIVAASLSWFLLERPLARLKDRLAPKRLALETTDPPAHEQPVADDRALPEPAEA